MTYRPELRPIIGTISHNRSFTYSDLESYCYWRSPPVKVGPSTIPSLIRRGLVKRSEVDRGLFYPTPAGWDWIEQE